MASVTIHTNADALALENNQAQTLIIRLMIMDNLASAPEMYRRLHARVRERLWVCPRLPVLRGFSWVARSVHTLHQDLHEVEIIPNPTLYGPNGLLDTFSDMRQVGAQLEVVRSNFRFRAGPLVTRAADLGTRIKDLSDQVLDGIMTIAKFQARIPDLNFLMDNLLNAVMQF